MKLEQIVEKQKLDAVERAGEVATEYLPGGLVLNLKMVGNEWRLQILRQGKAPEENTNGWRKWQQEIATCRRYYRVPAACVPTYRSTATRYAAVLAWDAVEQPELIPAK